MKLPLQCQSSGLTVASWCERNNICQQTYYRNLQKLRAEFCESFPITCGITKNHLNSKAQVQTVQTSIQNILQLHVVLHLQCLTEMPGATRQIVESVLLALKNICQGILGLQKIFILLVGTPTCASLQMVFGCSSFQKVWHGSI